MIIWNDLETTGLDEREGSILEIALVVTDDDLNEVGEPFVSIVQPLHLRGWEVMDDFVREMHRKNKLAYEIWDFCLYRGELMKAYDGELAREYPSLRANLPILAAVEREAIGWLHVMTAAHCNVTAGPETTKLLKGSPLAGSSVHFDRQWLRPHMGALESLFSHRHIDASCWNECAKRWADLTYEKRPGLGPDGKPLAAHRALDDVRASIETLRHYRKAVGW